MVQCYKTQHLQSQSKEGKKEQNPQECNSDPFLTDLNHVTLQVAEM